MNQLQSLLEELYGEKSQKILNAVKTAQKGFKMYLSENKNPEWYKSMNMYVVYPDAFEGSYVQGLKAIIHKLDYLAELGINALHILPFLDSPMVDMGFDIKNFKKVRKSVGGNLAFKELITEANARGIKVFVDLVMNHISNQHSWFKKAQNGETKYQNYFIYSKTKPRYLRSFTSPDGTFAEYELDGFSAYSRIIFPEFAEELPHWVQGKDGLWYYHTFYPHQIDLDWYNPNVFIEFVKIMKYWAQYGVNFRLDAVTFMAKSLKENIIESHPKLHKLVTALNLVLKSFSEDSVFLVEACQPHEVMKQYFGDSNQSESELAYNFKMMTSCWKSILAQQSQSIWEGIDATFEDIPDTASWVTFLRNHDELTLEYISEDDREFIFSNLVNQGLSFREGFGVAGRTASLLDSSPEKIVNAYGLLASLPGSIAVVYGDELGKKNDFEYMKMQTEAKILSLGNTVMNDNRDINRGKIFDEDITLAESREIYEKLSKILNARNFLSKYFSTKPEKLTSNPQMFAAQYKTNSGVLNVFVNLSDEEVSEPLDFHSEFTNILNIGDIDFSIDVVTFGPKSILWFEELHTKVTAENLNLQTSSGKKEKSG